MREGWGITGRCTGRTGDSGPGGAADVGDSSGVRVGGARGVPGVGEASSSCAAGWFVLSSFAGGSERAESAAATAACQLQKQKLDRLRSDYERLAKWASDHSEGNPFAEQVCMYAYARLAEWEFPVERWEP
jgi:hypothetical protein